MTVANITVSETPLVLYTLRRADETASAHAAFAAAHPDRQEH